MIYFMNNDAYEDSKQYVIIIVTIKMFQEQNVTCNKYAYKCNSWLLDKIEDWLYMYYVKDAMRRTI